MPDRRDAEGSTGAVWLSDDEILRTVPRLTSLEVKRVCEPCNNTWMSQIEGDAKPVLTGPIQGNPVTLRRSDTLAAATWAYKTGLIADLLSARAAGPRTFAHLYEHKRPPDSVAILMACYGGNRFPLSAGTRQITFEMKVGDGPRTKRNAYLLTVSVGHVVFQVFGHHFQRAFDLHPSGWKHSTSIVIWPQPEHPVRWPPRAPLTDKTLRKFARDL
ncbi:MAG TPA: hypothetical protein VEX36_05665 [Thermoleophilaceae bacterium]|nr:hypothetical protein [Thermoleophilaceae bacterium]